MFNLDVKTLVSLGVTVVGYLIALVQFVVKASKASKEKKWEELKALLKSELVPLMEQAERAFSDGEERETWVIKKLGDALHIDFYKYKKVLELTKTIIAEICKETKINVNKVINVEAKEAKTQSNEEEGTNGVF